MLKNRRNYEGFKRRHILFLGKRMAALWFPLWATGASEKLLENPRVRNIEVGGRGDELDSIPPLLSDRNVTNVTLWKMLAEVLLAVSPTRGRKSYDPQKDMAYMGFKGGKIRKAKFYGSIFFIF